VIFYVHDTPTVHSAGIDSKHQIKMPKSSVVISRPRSRDSSTLEFIFPRSRSWSQDLSVIADNKVLYLSTASVVMLYVDTLPTMTPEVRSAQSSWAAFKEDTRFVAVHKLQEKFLCILATSAP